MPEFYSYPLTFTANVAAIEYWHADGFRITIYANTFAQNTSITVTAPVKKAFFLRENSPTDKTLIVVAGNYYKITRNGGVAPSRTFKVTLPFKTQFDVDKSMSRFTVYYCDQATVEEDDPGNWHPGTGKTIPAGTALVAAETTAFGFFVAGNSVNGRDSYP